MRGPSLLQCDLESVELLDFFFPSCLIGAAAALTGAFGPFSPASSALHSVSPCVPLDRREVPSVIIDYEDDKENMPNESDYEDLPSMYKDEDDDVDDEDEDDDEDDDSIFTSERLGLGGTRRGCGNTY